MGNAKKIRFASEYSKVRWLCHNVKKEANLDLASEILATMIPFGSTIIPMPGHTGNAFWSLRLAELVSEKTKSCVLDCLYEIPNIGSHEAKKRGIEIKPEIVLKEGFSIPHDAILLDNVYDTGLTYGAACNALKFNPCLVTIGKTLKTN